MNRTELQRVVEHIEAHPDDLDMHTWGPFRKFYDEPCGTACCIAGHTLLLNGFTPDGGGGFRDKNDRNVDSVSHTAAEILGLDYYGVARLFHADIHEARQVRPLVDVMLMSDGQEPLEDNT